MSVGEAAAVAHLEALTAACTAAYLASSTADARRASTRAIDALERMSDGQRARLSRRLPPMLIEWARAANCGAEYGTARQLLEAAYDRAAGTAPAEAVLAASEVAALHALAGRTTMADTWMRRARGLNGAGSTPASLGMASAIRHLDGLAGPEALVELDRARDVPAFDRDVILAFLRASAITQTRPDLAIDCLENLRPLLADGSPVATGTRAVAAIVSARLHILAGAPRSALHVLDRWVGPEHRSWARARRAEALLHTRDLADAELEATFALSERHDAPRTLVEALAVRAVVAQRRGAVEEAVSHLREAVRLADRYGLPGALLPLRAPEADLLIDVAFPGDPPPSVRTLRARAGVGRPTAIAEPLSPREQRLVRVAAAHPEATTDGLAEALGVSRNTVKTQLRSVFRKLGVHDRAGMIRAARDLGHLD